MITPPPPGNYPPPPPGGYYPPPPPGAYYPPPQWVLPTGAYTPWSTRVLAGIVDWLPIWMVFILPMIGLVVTDWDCFNVMYGDGRGYCTSSSSGWLIVAQALGFIACVPYFFWNFCYRQGKTGQSIGKSALGFKVISEKTWQPIGFWLSLVRQIAHYIDQFICYIGYLFPLWHDKRQTIADMLMSTVCVPSERAQRQPQW